jgi:hypothetical protein
MKKSILILSAIVVLFAFAVPAFAMEMYEPEQRLAKLADEEATPLKVSGEFTFGFITPFDSEFADIGFANAYADFIWYPDEYNSVLLEVALAGTFTQGTATFPYFQLETDVGSYFGLPVGVVNTMGITSLYTEKFEVTGHAWERNRIRSNIDPLAWKVEVDAGMVVVTAAVGLGENDPLGDGSFNDLGFYAYVPAAGPAEIELWYLAQDDPDLKGRFGASVKADGLFDGLIGFAGGFVYDLRDNSNIPADDKFWAWGFGAGLDFMGLALGVGIEGNDSATVDRLWADADYAFGDFGVQGAFALSLSDDTGATSAETFLGAEGGVYVNVGAAKVTVGYTFDAEETDGFNYAYAPAYVNLATKGGLFVVGDIDF